MRIISGTAGGRKLETPENTDIRPTTDMVKEALFSAIQFEIEGSAVLDLFAGTGQLGIEALSRGAKRAVFVDSSENSLSIVRRNLERSGFEAEVLKSDSIEYISNTGDKFDIAFLDPPYSVGLLQKALPMVSKKTVRSGIIIAESPYKEEVPQKLDNGFMLKKQKKYGKLMLSFYRVKEE